MGVVANIDHNTFPKQSDFVGKVCKVTFNYDFNNWLPGIVVRDDEETPFVTLIQFDNGRIVLGSECQWTPPL